MLNWINLRKNGQATPTEINNKILPATKAMPVKNITSDNTGDFELGRASFAKSYFPPLKADYVKNVQIFDTSFTAGSLQFMGWKF